MAGESAIKVEGVVVETLPNRLYRVELSNGHRSAGYASAERRKLRAKSVTESIADVAYDLSEGRIVKAG